MAVEQQLSLLPITTASSPEPYRPPAPPHRVRGIVRQIPRQLSALPELVSDWEPHVPLLNQPTTLAQRRAEDRLVRQHKPLVLKLLKDEGWRFRYCDRDDLISVGLIGLWKAARRYDPERGYRFSTLARTFILGEWRHHLRDGIWAIAAPAKVRQQGTQARRLLGLGYGEDEVCRQLHLTPQELDDALQATAGLWWLGEREVSR